MRHLLNVVNVKPLKERFSPVLSYFLNKVLLFWNSNLGFLTSCMLNTSITCCSALACMALPVILFTSFL